MVEHCALRATEENLNQKPIWESEIPPACKQCLAHFLDAPYVKLQLVDFGLESVSLGQGETVYRLGLESKDLHSRGLTVEKLAESLPEGERRMTYKILYCNLPALSSKPPKPAVEDVETGDYL